MSLLTFRKLFGREAAEDEIPERLAEYFVESRDFEDFDDVDESVLFVRGKKGTGKSAVLCFYSHKLEKENEFVISGKGTELWHYFKPQENNPHSYVNEWQRVICTYISMQLGKRIGIALTDDQMALVELSELEGIKKKNIVKSLLDRFKFKLGPMESKDFLPNSNHHTLKRYLDEGEQNIWLFIDDIDQTFLNDSDSRYRLAAFFTACRYLASSIPSLKIRAAVRDDVWWSIHREDEALDKVPQFIRTIKWDSNDTVRILAKRIEVFVSKTPKAAMLVNKKEMKKPFYAVFPYNYSWRKGQAPSRFIIHMFALGRPRWAIQLGRQCLETASRFSTVPDKIGIQLLLQTMPSYSGIKLDDLISEYDHECPQLREIIYSFYGGGSKWTTNALKCVIGSKVISNLNISIDDNSAPKAKQIVQFLYRIGFISAFVPSQKAEDEEYFRYEEKPHLLSLNLNEDDGFHWAIHQTFHSALNLSRNYKKNKEKPTKRPMTDLPS
jgi:hypothetical protein